MIWTDWNLQIDVDAVLRGQGADPDVLRTRKPQLIDLAEQAIASGWPHLLPRVYYHIWDVTDVRHAYICLAQGQKLRGDLVMEHLSLARQILAVVCTVGDGIDQLAARAMAVDLPYALALEGVGAAAAEALAIAACERFSQQADLHGWKATLPLSPGMDGWPTDLGQRQLFQLIDRKEAGIELTSDSLMLPRKSISFLLGLGPDVDLKGTTCDYCAVRDVCRYRRN